MPKKYDINFFDSLAEAVIRKFEPLISKYLPELKKEWRAEAKAGCFEALSEFFGSNPIPVPEPVPLTSIIVADMDTLPDQMRRAGFNWSDGVCWYALAHAVAIGGQMPDDGAGSLIEPSKRSEEIAVWWWKEVDKVLAQMRANPSLNAIIIANDGPREGFPGERCGFRLGPPTLERFKEFGSRVQLGDIVPENEYK
jgi:hypothetical protein